MSRAQLEDRINFCKRELDYLMALKPSCNNCENIRYKTAFCNKFQQEVPAEYLHGNDCPEWSFDDVPF